MAQWPVKGNEEHLVTQIALYALIMLDTYETDLPSETEVTEPLTSEENLVNPIQTRSEEETEGQRYNDIDDEKNNSTADLQDIKFLLGKTYQK